MNGVLLEYSLPVCALNMCAYQVMDAYFQQGLELASHIL